MSGLNREHTRSVLFRVRDGKLARSTSGGFAAIRSCPFCGCTRISRNEAAPEARPWTCSIQCSGCGVETPPYRSRMLAARAWNRTMLRRTRLVPPFADELLRKALGL